MKNPNGVGTMNNDTKLVRLAVCILSIAMVAGPVLAAAGNAHRTNAADGEIAELRTPNSRHYMNTDGSVTAYITLDTVKTELAEYADYYGYAKEVDNDVQDPIKYGYSDYGNFALVGADYSPWIYHEYFRGFVQWDTSSIPDDAKSIDYVGMRLYVYDTTDSRFDVGQCDMEFYQMSHRPSTTSSGLALFNDAYDGIRYGRDFVSAGDGFVPSDTTFYDLGSGAGTHLKDQLASDWFAVGLHESTETNGGPGGIDRGVRILVTETSAVLRVDYTINHNPYAPDSPAPADGESAASVRTQLSCRVQDAEGDDMDVKFYWGNGTIIDIDHNVPGGSRASIDPGTLAYDTTYTWYASAEDYGGVPTYSPLWSFSTLSAFEIDLRAGWNLVSLPLEQLNTSLSEALWSMDGRYDMLRRYDASDPADPWKTYSSGAEAMGIAQDLTDLDRTVGFWLNATCNTTLIAEGVVPADTQIQLYAGWNMVGYPSLTGAAVADALAGTGYTDVQGYDAAAPYMITDLADTDMMEPGKGYWVKVPADVVWVVGW